MACQIPHPHFGPCEDRGPGGWIEWDDVPREPWGEVAERLWVGGSLFGRPTLADFDTVFTLWRRAETAGKGVDERLWAIPDTDVPHHGTLGGFAHLVERRLAAGDRVLVRCQLGLNRSALVAAQVLVARGMAGTDAVARLRAVRGSWALCNPNFVTYLDELEGAA